MRNEELQYKLLLYLDKRLFLVEMKNNCDSFLAQCIEKSSNKFPPLRQLLELDVMDLLNIFPELGDFLLKEPLQFQRICNEILFACVTSIDNDNKQNVKATQMAVTLRLKCVPSFLSYPKHRHYDGITVFNGLLLDLSKPNCYVFHTVWSCPEECEGNEVILRFIPKTPPKCCVCKSILFENSGSRICGEQTIATFISYHDRLPKKYLIVDDLISKLRIGSTYNIHIVVLKSIKAVWSVEEASLSPAPPTYPIPDDIQHLYEACEGVSWKFVYGLAFSIGVRKCPSHCFLGVKVSLLLSLVSVKANSLLGSPIINVLVSGNETKYVKDLMMEAAKFADRSVILGNANSSVKLSFIASSGGVCIVPLPLHLYNKKQISSIIKTLESGELTTDNGEIKMQGAVWAHCEETKKITISNLSPVFGTVCRDHGQYCGDVSEFLLQRAMGQVPESTDEINAIKDVTLYINLIAGINVSLDKTAEILLKTYFLAARKESPKAATIGSIGALAAVSLNSAKLCRRSVATIDDALFAIWLHVCSSPDPRFAPEEYLQTPACVQKLQDNMINFKNWLEQFTGLTLP